MAVTYELGVSETENELAAVVLAPSPGGAGPAHWPPPNDRAANTRFVKSPGRFREVGGAATRRNLASVLRYYQSLSPGRLVVPLGNSGTGEDRPCDRVADRGSGAPSARRESMPIPVLVSAAAYDTRLSWDDWLIRLIPSPAVQHEGFQGSGQAGARSPDPANSGRR